MSIVLHPASFVKHFNYSKLIPKSEYNTLIIGIGFKTSIVCTEWSRHNRVAPERHAVLHRSVEDVCNSDSLLPLTYNRSGSIEPQMIAEHTTYIEDSSAYMVTDVSSGTGEGIVLSGRTIVQLSHDKAVAVNRLTGRFTAMTCNGISTRSKEFVVEPYKHKHKCIRLSVWEQTYRVKHTNGKLIASNGLILG